eukprot:5763699-Amphidinium_carterae.1
MSLSMVDLDGDTGDQDGIDDATRSATIIIPSHWKAGVQQVDWRFDPRSRPRLAGWAVEGRPLQMVHSLAVPVAPPPPASPAAASSRELEDWLD